jgi:ATP-dependent exoDNAse (exonuclease V) beta subunit
LLDENRCRRVEDIVYDTLNRGYSLQDIAVLTRSNKNGSLIASWLIGKGIRVISSESLLINNSPKVKLILATLGYFDRPGNHIARAEIAYYIHLLLSKKEFRFEQFDFKSVEATFEESISTLLGKEFHQYDFLSFQLTGLVNELISFYGLGSDDPFLQFFQDEVMIFASRNRSNIREFLEWWEEVKFNKSIIYPDTLDAVKIMTLHKSKGLQFPVVIMADADWPQKNSKKNFWIDIDKPWLKDLNTGLLPAVKDVLQTEYAPLYEEEEASSFLDMLNLVYVGTTRPEDMLYILSTEVKREPERNNSVTALLIHFLQACQLWDGFKSYSFGDPATSKMKKTSGSKIQGELYKKDPAQQQPTKKELTIRKNSELLWSAESTKKIDRGNLVHSILKRIKYIGDVATQIGKMVNEGLIGQDDRIDLEKEILALLQQETLLPYFNAAYKVINERPLLSSKSMKIPDRVVVNGNKAVVIDYKTGTQRTHDKKQLDEYKLEVKKFGFEEVKAFLVYTDDHLVEEI